MRRFVVAPALLLVASSALTTARAEPPAKGAPVYRACPGDLVWNESAGACGCSGALHWDPQTKQCSAACPTGKMQSPEAAAGVCIWLPHTCPAGRHWSELHDSCVAVCPAGKVPNRSGTGCVADTHGCPADTQWYETHRTCLPFCIPGRSLDYSSRTCVEDAAVAASPRSPSPRAPVPPQASASPPPPSAEMRARAQTAKARSGKRRPTPTACPDGKEWIAAFDGCVPRCNDGEVLDFHGVACHSARLRR